MDKTLIIYDNIGHIIDQKTGVGYYIPIGLPNLEVDIPTGKTAISVNVDTKEVVFKDVPKSQMELLQEELAQNTKDMAKKDLAIEQLQKDLADLTKQIALGGK